MDWELGDTIQRKRGRKKRPEHTRMRKKEGETRWMNFGTWDTGTKLGTKKEGWTGNRKVHQKKRKKIWGKKKRGMNSQRHSELAKD